jgi:sorbitol/mannitol transport system permease protein
MAASRVLGSGDWAPDCSQVRAALTEARLSRPRRASAPIWRSPPRRPGRRGSPQPHFIFKPTFAEYESVWKGAGGLNGLPPYLEHSVIVNVVSTLCVLLLALPAAYALSVRPVPKWRDVLFFFISTKMLPVVRAIIPLYVIARELHLPDHVLLLIILYTAINLPIAVWMLRPFLLEVPAEVIEAARVDGAGLVRQMRNVIIPIISPGLAATALICFIFAWNEFFLAVNLTTVNGATVPIYLVGFVQPEGPFLAHLSAAATHRLPAGAAGRLGCPGQAGARPVHGCGEIAPADAAPARGPPGRARVPVTST